jgi:glutamate--cysteine ligase catalytic subunit
MGLMCIGQQIEHSEAQKYENIELVRKKGIQQFARLYNTFKHRDNDSFKYGDEVEYSMVKFDHKHKRVFVLLKADKLMKQLNDKNNNNDHVKFMSEFGSFMIEGIPGRPYESDLAKSLVQIEANMKMRRMRVQEFLEPSNEHVMTFSGNFSKY